jgi:hypothetical protein
MTAVGEVTDSSLPTESFPNIDVDVDVGTKTDSLGECEQGVEEELEWRRKDNSRHIDEGLQLSHSNVAQGGQRLWSFTDCMFFTKFF